MVDSLCDAIVLELIGDDGCGSVSIKTYKTIEFHMLKSYTYLFVFVYFVSLEAE